MLRLALAAVAMAVALAGCGGQSDEEAVRDTVVEYLNAFADGDGDKVCELMTKPTRDAVGGSECGEILQRSIDRSTTETSRVSKDDLPTVTVRGNRATVGRADDEPLELEKVGETWLIDQAAQ